MPRKIPRTGKGQFQWNPGGWFGAQLGGTLWMLILGATTLAREPLLAAAALLIAAAVNGFGWWLWSRRDRFEPYPAIQGLVAVVASATFALLLAFDLSGHLASLDPRFQDNPRGLYMLLLMFPVLMGMFHLQNRAGRK